jgi:DNA-binding response OmpR family regulator
MKPRNWVILCVDDEDANRKMLANILVPRGYAAVGAASGEDALRMIKSQRIDLVLMDVIMPGKDGFEVCRLIKDDQKLRDIPIILITALSAKQDRIWGIEAGADEFLSKPIDKTEMLARIKILLKVKELNDERQYAESQREAALETLQKSNQQLQTTVEELTAARENIRTLTGLIPICANCKKIRNDAGYWQSVEKYMQDHIDATFTHSICPACLEKLYKGTV